MNDFEKKSVNAILEEAAKRNGVSVEKVRERMSEAIEEAMNCVDEESQTLFRDCFGDTLPSVDEFVLMLSHQLEAESELLNINKLKQNLS